MISNLLKAVTKPQHSSDIPKPVSRDLATN